MVVDGLVIIENKTVDILEAFGLEAWFSTQLECDVDEERHPTNGSSVEALKKRQGVSFLPAGKQPVFLSVTLASFASSRFKLFFERQPIEPPASLRSLKTLRTPRRTAKGFGGWPCGAGQEKSRLAVLCELCASSERERTGGEKKFHHRDTEGTEKGEGCWPWRAKNYKNTKKTVRCLFCPEGNQLFFLSETFASFASSRFKLFLPICAQGYFG